MTRNGAPLFMSAIAALTLATPLLSPAAQAQPARSAEQQAYDRGYEAGRANVGQADEYNAPPGYDGSQPPPPPPGYQPNARAAGADPQDQRYQAYAEDWAQRNCVRSGQSAGTGAVIGGLLGALVGSRVTGWHDRGAGALIGGVAGAAGGVAVGSAEETSPGCPPGFVVRGRAPAFAYDGPDYFYAARLVPPVVFLRRALDVPALSLSWLVLQQQPRLPLRLWSLWP